MTHDELCDWCEEVLQPFVDRDLTDAERPAGAEASRCLRVLQEALRLRSGPTPSRAPGRLEPMAPALKQRLSELRLEL